MALNIAIYGYDTDVGKLLIEELETSDLDIGTLYPLSPLEGEYDAVALKGKNHVIEFVNNFDFAKAQIAFFISTKDESERLVPQAREAGCIVIDDSHLFAGDENIPLIIPELNPYDVTKVVDQKVVALASATTTALALALSPLHDEFGIGKALVTALESVSEHGRLGTETLAHETTLLLNGMALDNDDFKAQLAFNLHYEMGDKKESGYTFHEAVIAEELTQVLGKFDYGFDLTCIQVPVFYGHSASVHVELEEYAPFEAVKEAFENCPWIKLVDDELVTPVTHGINESQIVINRLRQSQISKKCYDFVVLIDNTRRGEAITCVELARLIAKKIHC